MRSSRVFLEMASEVEPVSPMGEPNREANVGSITCAPGMEGRMEPLAAGSLQITSDFRSFRCKPRAAPSRTTISRSCLMSSAAPPMVPSSRYQTQSSDFNCDTRGWIETKKEGAEWIALLHPLSGLNGFVIPK